MHILSFFSSVLSCQSQPTSSSQCLINIQPKERLAIVSVLPSEKDPYCSSDNIRICMKFRSILVHTVDLSHFTVCLLCLTNICQNCYVMFFLHKKITFFWFKNAIWRISCLMTYQSTSCDVNYHILYIRTVSYYLFISTLFWTLLFHEWHTEGIMGTVFESTNLLYTRCMFSVCYLTVGL